MELLDFYQFLYKRHFIYHKKEVLKLPAPWHPDPVLQTYKFCNCYRELDAASRTIIVNVINTKSILEDKIFNIIMFRFFNRADFYAKAMPPRHARTFRANAWEIAGYKKNDAIHVTGRMFMGHSMNEQILMTMENVGKEIHDIAHAIDDNHTLKNYFEVVNKIKGVGPFLAYQIAQDIGYIQEMAPSDLNDFVYVGPGAVSGLEMLFNISLDPIYECKYIWESQEKYLPNAWRDVFYRNAYYDSLYLSLGNIQHSLCEFRKWVNLTNGKGRKRYYKPKAMEDVRA